MSVKDDSNVRDGDKSKDKQSEQSVDDSGDAGSGNDTVSYESHQKLLKQKKQRDEEVRLLKEKLSQFEAEKAQLEEDRLKDQQKYKELWEKEAADKKKLQDQLKSERERISTSAKKQALERELGGVLRPEYLDFAELSKIAFTDEGQVDPESVKSVADAFRQSHPTLIKASSDALPNGAPKKPNEKAEDNSREALEREALEAVNKMFGVQ